MAARPFLTGGAPRTSSATFEVRSPYDGSRVAEVYRAGPADVEDALAAAVRGFATMRRLPGWQRAEILGKTARLVASRREAFARTIALEAGKPITQARGEVDRAVLTVRTAAEEATRIEGRALPLDVAPGADGRFGIVRRFPVGPVACVTPFNFPLNLVAHKVAPAIAAGCSVVVKPSSRTPSAAIDFAEALLEAGAPPEAVSVVPLAGSDAAALVADPRIRALSFTGSSEVGWALRRNAGTKKVVLELGGNAAVVVDRSADLDLAAGRIVAGGYAFAGQSCVSVQRVQAVGDAYDRLVSRLVPRIEALRVGDPLDEATDVGPVISDEDAARIESWIARAVAVGARILTGGARRGRLVTPALLTGVRPDAEICAREAFAPIVVIERSESVDSAIAASDRSEFGLQAGIFTRDLGAALAAFEGIEAGAILVNEVPTWRVDPMPYGGAKASGLGREGPRWAIEDYTEPRMLVLRPEGPPSG